MVAVVGQLVPVKGGRPDTIRTGVPVERERAIPIARALPKLLLVAVAGHQPAPMIHHTPPLWAVSVPTVEAMVGLVTGTDRPMLVLLAPTARPTLEAGAVVPQAAAPLMSVGAAAAVMWS